MCAGLPGASNAAGNQPRPVDSRLGLPQVLKDEKAGDVILKYMDGVIKRIGKIQEGLCLLCPFNSTF